MAKSVASKMPFKTFGNSNCDFILSLSHVKRYPEQLTFCRASFGYNLHCETCCTDKVMTSGSLLKYLWISQHYDIYHKNLIRMI